MSFKTISAILRGRWLIDKQWAAAHMPLIVSVLKGNGSRFRDCMKTMNILRMKRTGKKQSKFFQINMVQFTRLVITPTSAGCHPIRLRCLAFPAPLQNTAACVLTEVLIMLHTKQAKQFSKHVKASS
jgi:hypothetical protein